MNKIIRLVFTSLLFLSVNASIHASYSSMGDGLGNMITGAVEIPGDDKKIYFFFKNGYVGKYSKTRKNSYFPKGEMDPGWPKKTSEVFDGITDEKAKNIQAVYNVTWVNSVYFVFNDGTSSRWDWVGGIKQSQKNIPTKNRFSGMTDEEVKNIAAIVQFTPEVTKKTVYVYYKNGKYRRFDFGGAKTRYALKTTYGNWNLTQKNSRTITGAFGERSTYNIVFLFSDGYYKIYPETLMNLT